MKLKNIGLFVLVFVMLISDNVFARRHHHYRYTGRTHYVRPYVKKNGTVVLGHRSGNPGSGVHCRANICY